MNGATEQKVTLVGYGATGHALLRRAGQLPGLRITHVVVKPSRVAETQAELGTAALACSAVPLDANLVIECAGHSALSDHIVPALARGIECAVLSVGALSTPGLPERLAEAAEAGLTHVHLLSGAVGGIDALASARLAGLESVTYTGRKPPAGWRGTPAEDVADLDALTAPVVLLEASAREAARLYPKNANVAATLALAGLGLDATRVRLVADPGVTENIHEVEAHGAFGRMHLTMSGKPLAENPKTSTLTVLSALRFLHNRAAALTI